MSFGKGLTEDELDRIQQPSLNTFSLRDTNLLFEPCSVKKGFNALMKRFNPCQLAQSAQADMGRNFSLSLDLLHAKRLFYPVFLSKLEKMDFFFLSFISSIQTKQIHYTMNYSICKQDKSQDRMTECIIGRKIKQKIAKENKRRYFRAIIQSH